MSLGLILQHGSTLHLGSFLHVMEHALLGDLQRLLVTLGGVQLTNLLSRGLHTSVTSTVCEVHIEAGRSERHMVVIAYHGAASSTLGNIGRLTHLLVFAEAFLDDCGAAALGKRHIRLLIVT